MAERSLAARVARAPAAFEPARAEETLAALDPVLRAGALGELLAGAAGTAPHLARLIRAQAAWLAEAAERPPGEALDAVLAEMAEGAAEAADDAGAGAALRRGKARAALLVALADLGGVWPLPEVTGALTRLADTAVSAAADRLLAGALRRGRVPEPAGGGVGYVVLALGKQGAHELNFSSDIDLICLFDESRFREGDLADAKAGFIRVTRGLVAMLSDRTEHGYVFRTDLRLRPAPSTTPVCIGMEAAERYYESVGRTWERAAHIKARPVAGDIAAGRAYLDRLAPFVWRRHLDFAAIEDTHGMLRKIREKKGKFTPEGLPGHDLKLGPGGIREIEFFAQTRQLISGGREPRLRVPDTLGALEALVETGWAGRDTVNRLATDYVAHRTLEHRLQMIEDAQTQTIPKPEEARARVAALAGWSDRAAWERDVAERLARVHATSEAFFAPGEAPAGAPEIGPEELGRRGFARPEDAAAVMERWRAGQIAATRSARARRLYEELEPRIVRKLARAGSPDEALAEFDRFLSGLPAGVQVFSLFKANPHLLELIVEICAVAPRLAGHLGRNPAVLDALLGQEFFEPLGDAAALAADLETWLARESDYERVLDAARRWAREQHFRAGVQVLRGLADAAEAGAAFSAIAEACLDALMPRVIDEFAARHGPPPGEGLAIVGMGKLGTREMTAGSDLDLIVVYDPGQAEESEGPKPLSVLAYYRRLTQALVSALTAPTAEGRLYEVDMRLRPSGRAGPVATSLSGFRSYQREKAWVWEHLALTRARVVCGPEPIRRAVEDTIAEVLAGRAGRPEVMEEARGMHARVAEAHAGDRKRLWSLKHAAGGLMEIEFVAQTGLVAAGLGAGHGAAEALPALAEAGWLSAGEADALGRALALMQALQQLERAALDTPFDPETAGQGLRKAFARAGGVETFAELETRLEERQREAAAICAAVLGR